MKKLCLLLGLCILCSSLVFGEERRLEQIAVFHFPSYESNVFINETASRRQLNDVATTLINRNLPPESVHVFGYSVRASDIDSTVLAHNRAVLIIDELISRGVPREIFAMPVGYGSSNVYGDDVESNRRVSVNIIRMPLGVASVLSEVTDDVADIKNWRAEAEREIAHLRERLGQSGGGDSRALHDCRKVLTGKFLGFGPEINANTRSNFSVGGYFTGGFELLDTFAIGFKFYFSDNLDTVQTFEPAVLIRYMPFNGTLKGLFAEMIIGSASYYEDNKNCRNCQHGSGQHRGYPAPLGGIGVGWRFTFDRFYVEPTGRFGHPFTWGVGVTAGLLFK